MTLLRFPNGSTGTLKSDDDIAERIAETERRLGIRSADVGIGHEPVTAAELDHDTLVTMQRDQIARDIAEERADGVRQVEEAIAGPLAGRPSASHRHTMEEVRGALYARDRTHDEREAVGDVQRAPDRHKGHTDEDARQAQEVRDFIEPVAGRRTPSAAPWADEEAERTRGALRRRGVCSGHVHASPRRRRAARAEGVRQALGARRAAATRARVDRGASRDGRRRRRDRAGQAA